MKNIKSPVRGAGILMAIGSLPSEYGIGTLGKAAYNFIDLLADMKMRYWQILPVGPLSFGNSPYQPISAYAGNEYLIDLDELVSAGLLEPKEIRSYEWGSDEQDIDYANMYHNRVLILRIAYKRFDKDNGDYRSFVKDNEYWLKDYSLFRAIKENNADRSWTEWENGLKDRTHQAVMKAEKELKDSIEFYAFCQYIFHTQWSRLHDHAKSKGVSIIGDISLYVAHDSADVWVHRDMFLLDHNGDPTLVSAMPSDEFSPKGQIWGNPVYNWEAMDADDFLWWRSRIKKACDMFDLVRLDHFIGAVKYYAVSPGAESSDSGRWYKGPSRNFMDAISSVMEDTVLVVDDAGPRTVVPGVKKLTDKWGLTCSRILVFGWEGGSDNDNLPHNYRDSNIVVYTTTHDTQTLTGYINSCASNGKTEILDLMNRYMHADIKGKLSDHGEKMTLSDDDAERLNEESIRLAYSSNAAIAIIPMQDILSLGNGSRMNAPSTAFGNWQWRVGTHKISDKKRSFLIELAFLYRR